MSPGVFHNNCDSRGPLLVLFKTKNDILCGGFSSIPWQSYGEWIVDKNCFIFSVNQRKIYKRQNDFNNLYFLHTHGPFFGSGPCLGIDSVGKFHIRCNFDPF
jgi:TLD